jgi:hypothetical protein
MKTILTTLAAAILALTVGSAVQAGQPTKHSEPKHTDYRFHQERDSHWYEYHRERFVQPYCEYPVCDFPVCDYAVCDCPVCDCPVCDCPVCEYPVREYRSWDTRHRREYPLTHSGENKVINTSSSHRK